MFQRLTVDRRYCAGHGLCYGTAPDLVGSDEQGDPVILVDPVPVSRLDVARRIVELCPERALALEPVQPS
ncbi:ferredoxin [Mycolicibacterium holsaticum]|uniref:Ferredoxin n=1 Tax=Mycolicibacterium holsaticum TaxID=152142 RepID=A0A1E3RW80_9MYCO|nr:ferredoxin [Mycolicibacterium holsaticum]ODQ94088.1 ferredoxin [Mycolicibacterium holsaticum]